MHVLVTAYPPIDQMARVSSIHLPYLAHAKNVLDSGNLDKIQVRGASWC